MSANLYNDTTGVFTGAPANNLPKDLPKFLGRESELLQVKRLLGQKRLVILSGVDGVGKTRLAIQAADELAGQFRDGVFLISFDSVVLPEFVLDSLALKLGIQLDSRSEPAEQFLTALSSKNLLLVLDGFENIPQYAPLLSEIKTRAPLVRIIVTTSRQLELPDEAVLDLHGLSTPVRGDVNAEEAPAIQLFLDHARLYPDFELDLDAIGHICRLVDGMPLAIELAASWASVLSCEQIAQRIEQSLSLHPPEGISGELQSMLAIFDSVWNLLAENEKRLLLGLSVFKGGFSHEAATRITGASFFFLDQLLNKRILRRIRLQRYTLHASFSAFLQGKLEDNPVLATDIEIRHGSFFLGLLRDSEYVLEHSVAGPLLQEMLDDIDNLRLAWKRTVAAGNLRLIQSALAAWVIILESRGWTREAINALESLSIRLSESSEDMPETLLSSIQVKSALGKLHYKLGDYQAGIWELESALQRLEGKDYPDEQSELYRSLGDHYRASGVFDRSREMYRHALVSAERTGDLLLIYHSINSLAEQAYLEADYQGAISTTEHALEIAQQLGDKARIAQSQANLGRLYFKLKDYERSGTLLADALAVAPDVKGQELKCFILKEWGKTLAASQEFRDAFQAFGQGLRLLKDNYSAPTAVEMLTEIAELLNSTNHKSLALSLVNLLANHSAANAETNGRAVLLQQTLTSENIEPENRGWSVEQLPRVIVDLIPVMDEKAAGK